MNMKTNLTQFLCRRPLIQLFSTTFDLYWVDEIVKSFVLLALIENLFEPHQKFSYSFLKIFGLFAGFE